MRVSISKKIVAGLAALAMSAALSFSATPADAGGFHGGFGGFHGGGFHGGFGGFHGGMGGFGGWRGGGWGGGWRGGGWGWGNGCGWGGCGWWPGLAAGALIGAAATYPYYGYGGGYPYPDAGYGYYGSYNNCWVHRAVYSRHGHYLGRALVNVCR